MIRIDAHTHFTPLKFLDFAEKAEGRPHPLTPNLKSRPALFMLGLPMQTTISKPYIDDFRNFYCDTAASGFAPKAIELAVDFFGADRVLFGSDAPFDAQDGQIFISETLQSIDVMVASSETRNAILCGNARRILKLDYRLRLIRRRYRQWKALACAPMRGRRTSQSKIRCS